MTRTSRNCLIGLGVMVLVFVFWHFQSDEYNVSKVYSNGSYEFAIKYPRSWEVIEDIRVELKEEQIREGVEHVVVFFRSPQQQRRFRHSVMIAVYPNEAGTSANASLVEGFLEGIDEIGGGFVMVEQDPVTVNGHAAMRAIYKLHIQVPGIKPYYVQYLTYLLPRDEQLYAVTCTATALDFKRHSEVFSIICRSFRFTSGS